MAADEWNAKGGLLGKKIAIHTEDEQCDPKQAATVAQKIADDPNTVFLFGHFCSGATLAAGPIYARANLPFMTTSSNPKITQQGWKNVFRGGPTDNDQGGLGVGYVIDKLGLKKFALLNDKQAFGQGVTDVAKATIESKGGTVTSYGGVEPKDVDYSAVLTKIVQAEQPDALMYCTNFPTSAGLMVKQARQLGFKGPIVGCDGYFDPTVVKTAGDVANKASDTDLVIITFPIPPYDASPGLQAFAKNFQARTGHEPRDFEVFGYDYANVAFAGIQKAGSADHQKVIETLHSATIPGIFVPEYKFDDKGDLIGSKFLLWTIEDNKIVLLK
jgi:branched-chain amino acid transport system substrate-binding protein